MPLHYSVDYNIKTYENLTLVKTPSLKSVGKYVGKHNKQENVILCKKVKICASLYKKNCLGDCLSTQALCALFWSLLHTTLAGVRKIFC